jgi:hypothetical protein
MTSQSHEKPEVNLSQQISRDAKPFHIEWFSANGLACPTVPILCVVLIAFFPMQVGVYPRSITAFVLLSGLMRSLPITFGIPPKTDEREGESGWWSYFGE